MPDIAPLRGATPDTSLAYMGSILSFLVSAEETGGGLFALVVHARQGNEPPPHVHLWEHEVYYMLDGEIEVFVEGAEGGQVVRAGQSVLLPCGKAHAVAYRTPTIRAFVVLHAVEGERIGSEAYFRGLAIGPAESMDLPDDADRYATLDPAAMAEAERLAADNGVAFPSAEEVAAKLPGYAGFATG